MKPATTIVSCLIFIIATALLAGAAFGQVPVGQPTPDPNAPEPFVDTTVPVSTGSDGVPPDSTADLAQWTGTFVFGGRTGGQVYPFTMIGGSPLQFGAGTSNIPVVIVPLVIDDSPDGGIILGPQNSACGDTQSVLSRVQNSPLFTSDVTWMQGNTVVGTTQYTDAFQRANFWKYVISRSPNYHVRLNPVTTDLFAIDPDQVHAVEVAEACPFHPIVTVPKSDLDTFLIPVIIRLFGIKPGTLLLVLTYNVEILLPDGGTFLGYHAALPNGQTYIVSSYVDPGVKGQNVADISILSHVLAAWMDDPFLNNFVPPWGHIGQVPGCETLLEVGEPLTFTLSPVLSRGFNYHVQDLAFISWFARINPAVSVNGWYSMFNNLGPPQPVCN